MSENPIYEGILSQAREAAEKTVAQARKEAEEIVSQARMKAEKAKSDEQKNLSMRLDSLRQREESAERSLERLQELKNNDAAYEAVMSAVERKFESFFSSGQSRPVLVAWIAEAAYGLGQHQAKVITSVRQKIDQKMLSEAQDLVREKTGFSVSLSLDEENHILDWGVQLASMDNKIYYNNQLEVRIKRLSKDIKKIIQDSTCKAK